MNEMAEELASNMLNEDPEINFRIKNGIEGNRMGFAAVELRDADGANIENAEIAFRQLNHEYRFGCNAFMFEQFAEQEKNELYEERFKDLFNLAVIPFYWKDLEPVDGELRFERGCRKIDRRPPTDALVEFCMENCITPKGHLLWWHEMVPDWTPRDMREYESRQEQRIQELAERYGDSINIWDVTNEALCWNPQLGKFHKMPENHVEKAFEMAGKYFPESTELLYNAHPSAAWRNNHGDYTPLYMLARHLLASGLPIKGLGLQYHIMSSCREMRSWDWKDQYFHQGSVMANLDQYAKLNIPLNISEITITGDRELGDGDRFQELFAEKLYRIWFSHAATNGIIWWNLVDGTAHINKRVDQNKFRGGMLNNDLSPKPVWKTLKRLIREEWNSSGILRYDSGRINKLHAFYGDYELEIRTNSGTHIRNIHLGKYCDNTFVIKL